MVNTSAIKQSGQTPHQQPRISRVEKSNLFQHLSQMAVKQLHFFTLHGPAIAKIGNMCPRICLRRAVYLVGQDLYRASEIQGGKVLVRRYGNDKMASIQLGVEQAGTLLPKKRGNRPFKRPIE